MIEDDNGIVWFYGLALAEHFSFDWM